MTRLAVTLALAVMLAASTSVVIDAQRGGHGGAGRGAGGGGRAGDSQPQPPSVGDFSSINRPPGSNINGPQTILPPGFGPQVRSPFDARPGTYTRLHRSSSFGTPYGYGYGYGIYGPSYVPESTYEKLYRRVEPEITTGTLLLDVTPATALVFVDTAFVGTVGDVQARGVTLTAGRHFLDLEAPAYDKKTIEISITAGEPLRYRFDMTPARRAEVTIIPPRPPETMYAIPGCYGGNKPPVPARLPKGCDIAKVRVLRPQTRTN